MANVILAMPHGGMEVHIGAAQGFYLWPSRVHRLMRMIGSTSAGVHTFNTLWAGALELREQGFSHFAMIHSDIDPDHWWLDTLINEMNRLSADIVSVVAPIKSDEGVTSTAIDTGDLWRPRRLTMTEVYELPETFNAADVGGPLLVNNGLWVCDLTKPWADTFQFEMLNRIRPLGNGKFVAQMVSEDWLASRRWNELGLSVWATRKVGLNHHGSNGFTNRHAWGTWSIDQKGNHASQIPAGSEVRPE